jgi:hypothetical protein
MVVVTERAWGTIPVPESKSLAPFGPFTEFVMPDFSRPASYLDKLQFAERVVKAAQYRTDQRQAVRELCEALTEVVAALLEREQGGLAQPEPGQPGKKPVP